jgi:LacI family transcriptional regulator
VPLVTIDRPLPGDAVPHAGLDDTAAGRMLGEHLRALHYRRVAAATPLARRDPCFRARLRGLRRGLGRGGRVDPVVAIAGKLAAQRVEGAVRDQLASARNLPEAVVGLNNVCTIGTVQALREMGLLVPEQIGIAGIDDFTAASLLRPAVTVVAQPVDGIAAAAVSLLLGLARGAAPQRRTVLLSPALIPRGSLPDRARIRHHARLRGDATCPDES